MTTLEIEAMIRRIYETILMETTLSQDDAYVLAVKITNTLLKDQ